MRKLAAVHRHPSAPEPADRELFGDCLRAKRGDLGLTQEKTVARLRRRRSAQWLSRFERGAFLRLTPNEEFRDLCRVLHLNPVEMLVVCGFVVHRDVEIYLAERVEAPRRRRFGR